MQHSNTKKSVSRKKKQPEKSKKLIIADASDVEDGIARQLLFDYNYWRAQTRHFQDAQMPWHALLRDDSIKNVKIMVQVLRWCRANEFEPRRWIFVLFMTRQFKFSPAFNLNSLCSENLKPKYMSTSNLGAFRKFTSRVFNEDDEISQIAKLVPSQEKKKQQLHTNNLLELCAKSEDTNGYHPKSRTCVSCTNRVDCAVKMQSLFSFDVIGLRAGLVSLKDARRQRASAQIRG